MKFSFESRTVSGKAIGLERYDKLELRSRQDVEKWIAETFRRFNATLRLYEEARELVPGSILIDGESEKHLWIKTSLATVTGTHHYKGRVYDLYRCKVCGATGKRFGLDDRVEIDPKFRRTHQVCRKEN